MDYQPRRSHRSGRREPFLADSPLPRSGNEPYRGAVRAHHDAHLHARRGHRHRGRRSRGHAAALDRRARLQHRLGNHRRLPSFRGPGVRSRPVATGSGKTCAALPTNAPASRSSRRSSTKCSSAATSAAEREALYTRVVTNLRASEPQPNPVLKSDWLGAITSFWLVVLATAPAALPFLLIDNLFRRVARLERDLAGTVVRDGLRLGAPHDGQPVAHGLRNATRRSRARDSRDPPRGMRLTCSTIRHELAQARRDVVLKSAPILARRRALG